MSKTLQVRALDNTLRELDDIQKRIHAPSMSDTIRRSVEITNALTKSVAQGDKIIIQNKDGGQKEIIITGMK
jgi:hypothetical protein